ncbi:MAG: UTP--glucose-1-phosphate uridylyltransferase GalU [Thermovenabulum sp.]|uniref:UTP--glucose-1-phosphate uridylyltransferase GalU n=1 Tax=Thermovenabulum sp. TaxID=3100335 RepID=UPI003C7E1F62
MQIRKAVIPAAGYGTRLLPLTKSVPKEMLPLVDKPAIHYVVEEAAKAGIKEILIITGKNKRAIEDYFDKSIELEEHLLKRGERDKAKLVQEISEIAEIYYIRQKEPRGLGDAILCAQTFIGKEPFAVLLGDDVIDSGKPAIQQLMEAYEKYKCSIIGVQEVAKEEVSKYGIVEIEEIDENTGIVKEMVEKPKIEEAPSNIAIHGRYILTTTVFDAIKEVEKHAKKNEEIQLTDALKLLLHKERVIAVKYEGKKYEIGSITEYAAAFIEMAMKREKIWKKIMRELKS